MKDVATFASSPPVPRSSPGTAPQWVPRALVWGIAVVIPVLLALTVTLHLRTGSTVITSWWISDLAMAVFFAIPGLLVAARRPGNAIGWLLVAGALTLSVSAAGREYLLFGLLGGSVPAYAWVGWLADSLYPLSMVTLPLILMLFPDGRALSPRVRPLLAVPLVAMVLLTVGQLFMPGTDLVVRGHSVTSPTDQVLPDWLPDLALAIGMPLFFASMLVGVILLALRFRRSDPEKRQQVKWVLWAGSIAAIELTSEWIPGNDVATVTSPIAAGLLAASISIAILRHRLFDIDLIINRTLVYGSLSVLVVALYALIVSAAGAVLDQATRFGPGLVAAALVAVALGPAKSRLQRGADRLMYGERRNPYGVMTRLGERLEHDTGAGELTVITKTLTQALKLPHAAIIGLTGERLAETGSATIGTVAHQLNYHGVPVGQLLVTPRQHQDGFGPREQRLINDLARQVAAAVNAVRLTADLQASRQRLVSAKEEERRRLRRDLHNGLGSKLAAVGLKLDAAQAMAEERPELSREVITGVKADIRETIADIRRLVDGLRPPALNELGLIGALCECGTRFSHAGIGPQITVVASGALPPLPAAVEVATFAIVNEAMTNVVRHANATRCSVRLSLQPGRPGGTPPWALLIEIEDDGVGAGPASRRGVGTASMRERAEELGGTVSVSTGPVGIGTCVRARIPCEVTS
ncbi:MAG: histidine kinase [Humibacillus sp.]|nr:histidine kinase [Humibacillus sp.]MDN5777618.1 histidine kinase [Humibacillus sp.]